MDLNTLLVSQVNPVSLYVKDIVASGVSLANQKSSCISLCQPTSTPLVSNTPTPVKFANVSFTGDVLYDVATGKITLVAQGLYLVNCSSTFFNGSAGLSQFKTSFNYNAATRNEISFTNGAGANVALGNSILISNVDANGSLYLYAESGASTCVLSCASLSCFRVG